MSNYYAVLKVSPCDVTDEIVLEILESNISDSSYPDIIERIRKERQRMEGVTGKPVTEPFPTTPLAVMKERSRWSNGLLVFGNEQCTGNHTTEPICARLRSLNIPYIYEVSYDESNSDATHFTPKNTITFDIDCEGSPIVPYDMLVEALSGGTDAEKLQAITDVLKKNSPYIMPDLANKAVVKQDIDIQIEAILEDMDKGLITKQEAFSKIAEVKKGA